MGLLFTKIYNFFRKFYNDNKKQIDDMLISIVKAIVKSILSTIDSRKKA